VTARRYRRRSRTMRRLRRWLRRRSGGQKLALAAVAVVLFAGAGHGVAAAARHHQRPAPPAGAAAKVIAFAQTRLGCPYVWGGTGPCQSGYDCSGLAMEAFASAGVTIPRTSEEQWAAGPQVSTPAPGDLVFFAGADGTTQSPGHVAIVVNPAKHLIIDAYATGLPVEYDTYGLPTSAEGLGDPVGFTDPLAGS
jgi:cell wall-associated NlpC family hydrolase